MQEHAEYEFAASIEAVRVGWIFAHDQNAWQRWQSRRQALASAKRGSDGHGLAGAALERTIFALLNTNPDIVAVRTA